MPKARIFPFLAMKDCGWTALARVQNPDGANITQATVASIACRVTGADGTATHTADLTVSAAVSDALLGNSLNLDARWTEDDIGFNFAWETPAAAFPAAGYYRVEFTFVPTTGEPYKLVYEGAALG
ncbi:hypothetical protein [Lignipirellula cremea]|uniref:BppU N-terminal domain-containing protein n=1 Tax=Lignipirellula cremea TaxID=2528010 RepID=A0A518E0A9_9BACT|nr:hypothetical protein [Lignipirellula cremea]QDU97522.1 hypothetical protein Pla8534_53700 [Lignipirellula cremea]